MFAKDTASCILLPMSTMPFSFHGLPRLCCHALSALLLMAGLAHAAPATRPLNVVFILADDLGWTDLGCYGSTFYETPNIDRLAREGAKFTQAYAACPVCSPTRAAILTGKYPQRTGITDYIGAPQPNRWGRNTKLLPAPYNEKLALEEVTIAEAFKAAGYATCYAGKWHLGPEGFWPENQGFDFNFGGIDRGGPYGGNKYFSPYDNPRLTDGPPGEHICERLATETAKFIEANKERPFFAYFASYSVHTPLMTRDELRKKYEAKAKTVNTNSPAWGIEGQRKVRLRQDHAVYAGMVETLDNAVGIILRKLDELKLTDNTIVIFTSDNGGLSTSEGSPTSNLPLRAGKGWLYEGGVREPLIIRWPGVVKPGSVTDVIVTSPDFYPTLLAAAGLPPRPQQHLDGVNFLPALKGEPFKRGPIFWHYPRYGNQGGFPGGAVRDGDWKLIENYENNSLQLYNLRADISETNNLAAAEPARTRALHELLQKWRKDVGSLMPTPNPDYEPEETHRPKR